MSARVCAFCAEPIAEGQGHVSMGAPVHLEKSMCIEALQHALIKARAERDAATGMRDGYKRSYEQWVDWAAALIKPWTHLDSDNVSQSEDAQSVVEARERELVDAIVSIKDAANEGLPSEKQLIGVEIPDHIRKLYTEADTLRTQLAAAREALAEAEWVMPLSNSSESCSFCGNMKHWGHDEGCYYITAALSEAP